MDAILKVGGSFLDLAGMGDGCPDGLAGYRGVNVLLEFKEPGGRLTEDQVDFIATWRGQDVRVCVTVDDTLRAIGALRDVPPPY